MKWVARKLLTIISEARIENEITGVIKKLGAHGFTSMEAWGEGARGRRSGEWEENRNVRVEVVCDSPTADKIAEYLVKNYCDNYAMILFSHTVEIIRTAKF
jgi:hypothetical protein